MQLLAYCFLKYFFFVSNVNQNNSLRKFLFKKFNGNNGLIALERGEMYIIKRSIFMRK